MPSGKEKRAQRHQTKIKSSVSKPTKRAKIVERIKDKGYNEVQFIDGKKFYTPLSSTSQNNEQLDTLSNTSSDQATLISSLEKRIKALEG